MDTQQRSLVRLATRLQEAYSRGRVDPWRTASDEHQRSVGRLFDDTARAAKRLQAAAERGWEGALTSERENYLLLLECLAEDVRRLRARSSTPATPLPSIRELYLELTAAEEDLGELTFDRGEQRLSAVAGPITLEGIRLGRFRIDLLLDRIADDEPAHWFRVEALEPNPASSDEEVTHPHVAEGHLCTGDATNPIQRALREGRLSEFFVLVRSVLETYNPDSPHVQLENWDGQRCDECGDLSSGDGLWSCERCGSGICDECSVCCTDCRDTYCRSCLTASSVTDEWVCRGCLTHCDECEAAAAKSELEDGLCPTCLESRDEEQEDSEESVPAAVSLSNHQGDHA